MAQICASATPLSTKNTNLDDARRSVTYHPSIWRDYFLSYTSDVTQITAVEKERLEKQKQKVKNLLAQEPTDSTFNLKLIDSIQRLGVCYHFGKEIDESLRQIHKAQISEDDNDLGVVALRFRLLRQQGYRVPCDVFNKFVDDQGNFKECLAEDVEGMLSLYEASNYGVNGEKILDKALQFSSSHLKSRVLQMSSTAPLSRRITGALKFPISKMLTRLGAKKFISMYEEDEFHNEDLLNFAKLDFSILQKLQQEELYHITRWWKNLGFANKISFARDRVVECYFWILGVYFEPHYTTARNFLTKILSLTGILDDIYDVGGNLDDLRRFTQAIPSWDISAFDELPEYMRVFYKALLDVYVEMEDEMGKRGESYRVQYAKQEMVKLSKLYMEEAEWYYSSYIPRFDEYMALAVPSAGCFMLATTSLIGMPNAFTKHDFDWTTNEARPRIMRTCALLGRLMDDMAGHGTEEKITAVECCMSENGWSREEAVRELSKRVDEGWKDMIDEWLEPTAASRPILTRILNLSRSLCIMYDGDDGFTNSTTRTKDYIQALFVDSV